MGEPRIRAFCLKRQLEFIDDYFDEATAARIKRDLPEDLQEKIFQAKPVDLCPVEYSSVLLRAICAAKNDTRDSYEDLVECGKFVSQEATNSFYKLLMKVLTPEIFLWKMETFWRKDFKDVGKWEVTSGSSRKRAQLNLMGVEGLDHIGPVSQGFIVYVIQSMGHEDVVCESHGWSLEQPGPDQIQFDLRWG